VLIRVRFRRPSPDGLQKMTHMCHNSVGLPADQGIHRAIGAILRNQRTKPRPSAQALAGFPVLGARANLVGAPLHPLAHNSRGGGFPDIVNHCNN
jgi:hypothetical protein